MANLSVNSTNFGVVTFGDGSAVDVMQGPASF